MQLIFYTNISPEEYHRQGKDFPFPEPDHCPHCQLEIPPQKHGFYERNAIDADFSGRIFIRRYYCQYCHTTISYLPSFCLPYFQYTVDLIFTGIHLVLDFNFSLRGCLKFLKERYRQLCWDISHLQFYLGRFLARLSAIKLGLRQILPRVQLPEDKLAKREGAQKVLRLLATGFAHIQIFSAMFHEAYGYSFMAP
jgi:transposase-like protein